MAPLSRSMEVTLRALVLHAQGTSQARISCILKKKGFRASKTTIGNKLRGALSGSIFAQKTVRKHGLKFDDRDLRHIRRCVRFFGDTSYQALFETYLKEGKKASYATVRRAVRRIASIKFRSPRKRMWMTPAHKQERLAWAKKYLKAKTNWKTIWFSDSKWWGLDGPAKRRPVLHDKLDPPPVLVQTGNRSAAISVWAAFCYQDTTELMPLSTNCTAVQYCDMLEKGFCPHLTSKRRRLFADRQSAFKAAESIEWQKEHGIKPTLFPPKCADINPIENLWGILSARVFPQNKVYKTQKKLKEALHAAWADVRADTALLSSLINSVPKRLAQVIQRKGGQCDN